MSSTVTTPEEASKEETKEEEEFVDKSTLLLLEHVNLNVPSHEYILPFYFDVLGCGMDPRKVENLKKDSPKKTLWANAGASQFHLPYGETAQTIPGHVGLRYDSLQGLQSRLEQHLHQFPLGHEQCCVTHYKIDNDDASKGKSMTLTDRYGNVFVCREGGNPVRDTTWKQPLLSTETPKEEEEPEEILEARRRFGFATNSDKKKVVGDTDCRGIAYVEFRCPVGTAKKIAQFYEAVLDATTSVLEQPRTDMTTADAPPPPLHVAVIGFGHVTAQGKADQALVFRETTETIPTYDGHHVALYVGENKADFEQAFKNCETAGVVWVNPRFSDKADTLQGAKQWKQFRFKNIVDMKTGKTVFQLEHEMRSVEHEAFPGRPS